MIHNRTELKAAKREIAIYNRTVLAFQSRIIKGKDCWKWDGAQSVKKFNYGICQMEGKKIPAHRMAFMLYKGEIPDGKHVLHTCDNPECVNPKHLYAGTHSQNMADKRLRKRYWGESIPTAKLTLAKVKTIMSMWAAGKRYAEIAEIVDCSASNVSHVVTGRSWYHATGLPQKDPDRRVRRKRPHGIRGKMKEVKSCPPVLY